MVVADVTSPANPAVAGQLNLPGFSEDLVVVDNYAYLATGDAGLRVVDISDPVNPTAGGNFDTPGYAEGIAVSGGYAFIADGGEGLRIINIIDPANPFEIASFDTPGWVNNVTVEDNHAFVTDSTEGLYVLYTANPAYPVEIGSYNTPGRAMSVAVSGELAYVTDYYNLLVLDCSEALPVENPGIAHPSEFALHPNYPNPFNAATTIPFTLNLDGKVKIDIFDITGRSVGVQYIEPLQVGTHEFMWDAEGMVSGVYLVRLIVDGRVPTAESRHHAQTRKLVLVK